MNADAGARAPVVLVTGAASGMGAAVVRRFCASGAAVYAAGLQPQLLAKVADQTGAKPLSCDVTDEAAVRASVHAVLRDHERLDVLVNAAGVVHNDDAADIDDAQWQRVMDINAGGAMRVCRAVLPQMQRQRAGAIVNIASVAAFNGSAGMATYSSSKAALIALTRSIATRYGAEGIRANCLAPGWVRTPMSEMEMQAIAAAEGISIEAAFAALTKRIALGRIGSVDEMAGCVAFLASADAAFVSGAVLVADGGARIATTARGF